VIENDLPEIYSHIARENPAAAERLLDGVEATFEYIAAQPEIGVVYPTRNRRMNQARMLPVSGFNSYLIFYRIEADSIHILYVVHGARQLKRLFGRERRE